MSGQFTMGTAPWREALVPASFRGVFFYVERVSEASGRRIALHEYPKREGPGFAEDMGARTRRWTVAAYVIGGNYNDSRDQLVAACRASGSAQLVLPTLGSYSVVCEQCVENEIREKGGIATFELTFIEAGSPNGVSQVVANTAVQAVQAASNLLSTTASSLTSAFSNLF